jgi:hypothetical protein
MKRWALLTIVLYVVILAVLAVPVLLACFWPEFRLRDIVAPELHCVLWIWIGVMALAQAALLVVPVRLASERIVATRHVFWTILATLFLMLLMGTAMVFAVIETIDNTKWMDDDAMLLFFGVVGAVWCIWAFLMGFYVGGREPKTMMQRLVRFLIAGSILEVLIVIPAHILARMRNYCCAGYLTFWGIAAGVSVMLLAFGPGVFLLFVRRMQSKKSRT